MFIEKGYCVITFPIKYAINLGISIPMRGNGIGEDAIAIFQCCQMFGPNVRKNGKGNKC